MAELLDGKALSAALMDEIRKRMDKLRDMQITPGLSVLLVGDDPASQIYVRSKEKACRELGIHSVTVRLPQTVTQEELEAGIEKMNADESVHGILLQLPLPGHLSEAHALSRILPEKDVDGFHLSNAGSLFTGQKGVLPCTPKGILYMLKKSGIALEGKEAVVVGRSNLVGKPIAMMLLKENCTVTICHSKTQNLAAHTKRADILISAVGKPRFITADMVKPGAAVLDAGISRLCGRVTGDVDFEGVSGVAGFLSPVPGGVGKMTVAMLMENTVEAAERKAGILWPGR